MAVDCMVEPHLALYIVQSEGGGDGSTANMTRKINLYTLYTGDRKIIDAL